MPTPVISRLCGCTKQVGFRTLEVASIRHSGQDRKAGAILAHTALFDHAITKPNTTTIIQQHHQPDRQTFIIHLLYESVLAQILPVIQSHSSRPFRLRGPDCGAQRWSHSLEKHNSPCRQQRQYNRKGQLRQTWTGHSRDMHAFLLPHTLNKRLRTEGSHNRPRDSPFLANGGGVAHLMVAQHTQHGPTSPKMAADNALGRPRLLPSSFETQRL